MVNGSMWGTVNLTLNGKTIATFDCNTEPNPCPDGQPIPINPIKLSKPGATLSWSTSGCVDASGTACTAGESVLATIEVGYEKAIAQ